MDREMLLESSLPDTEMEALVAKGVVDEVIAGGKVLKGPKIIKEREFISLLWSAFEHI